ncbi:MAG: plasmid replication protein RepC [Ahrensia sp.]|nr:plasmid replication protein RepC [Ahrensia sp.]
MKHHGWRKPTPGLVEAEKHAQAGERLSVPKAQAIVAAKKVATAIGLKPQDLLLLDTLSAFTQQQDWEQGRRPIVWASNNYLMEQTGFSLPTLQRHTRHLAELGLIHFKDSANGKRWGARDEQGYIVEAYGFDLSPLAARAEEFEALYARMKEERAFCQSLRHTITVTRRIIRAKIEKAQESALSGPWRDLRDEFVLLLAKLPGRAVPAERLLDVVDWFAELKERVEQAFEAAFDWPDQSDKQAESTSKDIKHSQNMRPSDLTDETHILDTNQPYPVSSNIHETMDAANSEPELPPSVEVARPQGGDIDVRWNTGSSRYRTDIDVPTLMASCPHFAEMARDLEGYIKDWNHLHRAASQIRPIAGISEHAWNVAQEKLGPQVAAAAVALIFDKHSTGEVSSPGGYLRGMVEKALAGELHLDRSLYGRLNEARAV